ncbi:MAG: 2-isopropylmalate synthase [Nitrospinae bacterium]|nr:2-isopropylmalate synthase [Nitrospinota bacterium]
MKKKKLVIFDTTLRDGEQCPGASMNKLEKLEIARQLALLGVDVIEAGFPVASPGDFDSVSQISREIKGVTIAGLARAVEKDIDMVAKATEKAEFSRIHVFLATSKTHRDFKLKKSKEEILEQAAKAVAYARRFCDDVEFSPEDASRTEPEFLRQVTLEVVKAGARTVNIPDTVGYAIPGQFGKLIRKVVDSIKNEDAVISVHCHNDLGLAVANSLAAVKAGARQVECTINGIGERAGNAALEEIVMAVRTRKDFFKADVGHIDAKRLLSCSRIVSNLTGLLVQRNKAIVGKNAFAHESGVHQDGLLKNVSTYEIINPTDVGWEKTNLVLGKHSGRHAFINRIEALGFRLDGEKLDHAFEEFKRLADVKKEIFDDDIISLVQGQFSEKTGLRYHLKKVKTTVETGVRPEATVELSDGNGLVKKATASGDGPIDSICQAIDKITGVSCKLLDYSVVSRTSGTDALGEVSVQIENEGRKVWGKFAGTNVVEASAQAYLNAVNKLIMYS